MAAFDVLVIGGGPAGYTAALEAARRGASVALVEAEQLGGACVHHACIPTNIMLGAVDTFVAARELDALGVFAVGEQFNYPRAGARRLPLIHRLEEGIAAALKQRRVTRVFGRAAFVSPDSITLSGDDKEISAEAFVIATGTRWEPPELPGLSPERLLTADQVQSLLTLPASALVIADGPAGTSFALEYAFLLAVAGVNVTVAAPGKRLVPGLDAALAEAAAAVLTDVGATVLTDATFAEADGSSIILMQRHERTRAEAEVVVFADPRRPFFQTLNLKSAGVQAGEHIAVDRSCRTSVPHIFAAGDVTGGAMLTSAALHMGEVAGANAAGGEARTRLRALPQLLHTTPEIAWVGLTEAQAREQGFEAVTGVFDLSFNARAVTLGARQGIVKVVAESGLGELLGVHVVGPGAGEIIALASLAMQAELPLAELGALVLWHPSIAEGLVEAARRAGQSFAASM